MGDVLVFLVVSWLAIELGWYLAHRVMHWLDLDIHMQHHRLYTAEDYVDAEYRPPTAAAARGQYVIYAIATVVVSIGLAVVFGPWLGLVAVVEAWLWGRLVDTVHDAYHVRGHALERYAWFRRRRRLHRVHHADEGAHFGFVTLTWDWIFGSRRSVR